MCRTGRGVFVVQKRNDGVDKFKWNGGDKRKMMNGKTMDAPVGTGRIR